MQFMDKALLALARGDTRLAVFGQTGLKNVLKAAYGLEDAAIQGAATPQFSTFTMGGLDPDEGEDPADLPPPMLRIDSLWRGGIRISASFPKAQILSVKEGRLSLSGLDAAVTAANGGVLPAGDVLEAARRTELLRRLEALAKHPGSATPEVISSWLATAGATTVAELMAAEGTLPLSELQIAISPPLGGTAFRQMDFPVAVAVLIRNPADPGMRLTEIIAAARRLQHATDGNYRRRTSPAGRAPKGRVRAKAALRGRWPGKGSNRTPGSRELVRRHGLARF
jgi:hypothetical protein